MPDDRLPPKPPKPPPLVSPVERTRQAISDAGIELVTRPKRNDWAHYPQALLQEVRAWGPTSAFSALTAAAAIWLLLCWTAYAEALATAESRKRTVQMLALDFSTDSLKLAAEVTKAAGGNPMDNWAVAAARMEDETEVGRALQRARAQERIADEVRHERAVELQLAGLWLAATLCGAAMTVPRQAVRPDSPRQ